MKTSKTLAAALATAILGASLLTAEANPIPLTTFTPILGWVAVPEGGSSLAFLGLALVGLEALRRKLASKKSAL